MEIKQKFTQMCSLIYIGPKGFQFPFDDVEHDSDYNDIRESVDYPVLKNKMQNLLGLINQDHSILDKDIETELWDLI